MTDTAPVFITNQFTHLEKSSEDLRLSGKVYTDLGLISEAYLMLSDEKKICFLYVLLTSILILKRMKLCMLLITSVNWIWIK